MSEPAYPSSALLTVGNVTIAPSAVRWNFARAGGPGGQHVNKVNTKAEMWVAVNTIVGLNPGAQDRLRQLSGSKLTIADEIHIASDEFRSQEGNRQAAIDRLRELIVQALHVPKKRRKTKPSRASKERRLESKRKRSDVKAKRRSSFD